MNGTGLELMDCPYKLAECPFKNSGCKCVLPLSRMKKHLKRLHSHVQPMNNGNLRPCCHLQDDNTVRQSTGGEHVHNLKALGLEDVSTTDTDSSIHGDQQYNDLNLSMNSDEISNGIDVIECPDCSIQIVRSAKSIHDKFGCQRKNIIFLGHGVLNEGSSTDVIENECERGSLDFGDPSSGKVLSGSDILRDHRGMVDVNHNLEYVGEMSGCSHQTRFPSNPNAVHISRELCRLAARPISRQRKYNIVVKQQNRVLHVRAVAQKRKNHEFKAMAAANECCCLCCERPMKPPHCHKQT
ncbi:hypothetical protein ScPMuIL_002028 [Solemya velum]